MELEAEAQQVEFALASVGARSRARPADQRERRVAGGRVRDVDMADILALRGPGACTLRSHPSRPKGTDEHIIAERLALVATAISRGA